MQVFGFMNRHFYPQHKEETKEKERKRRTSGAQASPDAEIEPQIKGRLACSPITTLTATHVLQTHSTEQYNDALLLQTIFQQYDRNAVHG